MYMPLPIPDEIFLPFDYIFFYFLGDCRKLNKKDCFPQPFP